MLIEMTLFTVYSIGSNGSGQLGIGHTDDVSVPKPVQWESSLPTSQDREPLEDIQSQGVKSISVGGNHTLMLSKTGYVYSSGDLSTGAAGLAYPDEVPSSDHKITNPEATTQTDEPRVLHGPQGQRVRFRPMLLSPELTEKNQWQGSVLFAAALWSTSILVIRTPTASPNRASDKVYTIGTNAKGELGLGDAFPSMNNTPSLRLIPNFPPENTNVVHLSAGMNHVVMVLDNGEAYGWGNGRLGQLGHPSRTIVASPRKISMTNDDSSPTSENANDMVIPFAVKKAVCGRDYTCLLGDASFPDQILILGSDKWGIRSQAPVSSSSSSSSPSLQPWKQIESGWSHIYVLHDDQTLKGWGRNHHGQAIPSHCPSIRKIAIGSEHAIALTSDNDVIAWGWGEHGNCGPTPPDQQNIADRWNTIASAKFLPENTKIVDIAAGWATSWIVLETS